MDAVNRAVLAEAQRWVGTPYRHQASEIGVGCDCLGLIRGVWRALYGREPEVLPAYQPDWAERSGEDRLMQAAIRHFRPVAGWETALPGDLLIFRFRPHYAAKHLGLLAPGNTMLHAYEQAAVIRSPLVPAWRRRVVAIFRFPERPS